MSKESLKDPTILPHNIKEWNTVQCTCLVNGRLK